MSLPRIAGAIQAALRGRSAMPLKAARERSMAARSKPRRDAKLYEIGAGTSEIRRWLIGREIFEETG